MGYNTDSGVSLLDKEEDMRASELTLGVAYLRLSDEEKRNGESSSITNQRMIVQNYCKQNGINLVREFVDDGYSGGNFNRPGFLAMMRELEHGKANTVITKDLSRLGRDMREASYYAEQFFPEHGIRYVAIGDNFDTERDNVMAPFLFAMNEVYLRDGSRKVRDVLRAKRADGQYCACPPFGYKKDPERKNHLIPDENTAPIVRQIFRAASAGDSSRKIAMDLNALGAIPPLKYRVLYRDDFSDEGAAKASDMWNNTTVKRILKNRVYLGHTILGKTKKASIKSDKKIRIPENDWSVTLDTHEPLVDERTFELAALNLGRGTKGYKKYDHVRKSIFSGIAVCSRCGASLCSCGTVYRGEREKYWYLSCTRQRKDAAHPCEGVRVRYADLLEIVRRDLNSLLSMTDTQIANLVNSVMDKRFDAESLRKRELRAEKARARLSTIDRMVAKLYEDNAEGRLSDERLYQMTDNLEREASELKVLLAASPDEERAAKTRDDFDKFFAVAREYTHIETLTRDVLQTFVERIIVGPKVFENGRTKATHRNQPFRQDIQIVYKFIGDLSDLHNL